MGRGRAKAKQTKVARQLKYGAVHSDLGALQAELSHHGDSHPVAEPAEDFGDDDQDDPYADYLDDEDDETPTSRAR
jgi:hypothetical protein